MNLISCESCGTVIDVDRRLERHDNPEKVSPEAVAINQFGNTAITFSCPSCTARIFLTDGDIVDES